MIQYIHHLDDATIQRGVARYANYSIESLKNHIARILETIARYEKDLASVPSGKLTAWGEAYVADWQAGLSAARERAGIAMLALEGKEIAAK